jgi:hypothetical protein
MAEHKVWAAEFWPQHTVGVATAADVETVFPRRRRPLLCWLNLRHRSATQRTEDGKPYLRCQRCGKDETDVFAGTKSGREFDGVPPGIGSAVFGHGS